MRKLRRLEEAIKAGDWWAAKGTHTFADIAIGVGLAVSAGVSAYGISQQSGIANQQLSLAEQQNYRQGTSFTQLEQLINNPASFFSSPVYEAAFNQGSSAVAKQNAAAFGPNSGNEAAALQTFGQSFGEQELFNQESLLASMSGASFNPTGALSGASGAIGGSATSAGNSLAGLLAFFGSSNQSSGVIPYQSIGGGGAGWQQTYTPGAGVTDPTG